MIFPKRKSFGESGQTLLINFLEKHFGYEFVAGEKSGSIINPDIIEELENCEFIFPRDSYPSHGPQLKFVRNGKTYILICPDLFMLRKSNLKHYWIEVKTHTENDNRLIIDRGNFDDYATLYKNFTRQDFYVMCWNPESNEFWNVYSCEFGNLLAVEPKRETIGNNKVYVWQIKEVMSKLNRYPIKIENYK